MIDQLGVNYRSTGQIVRSFVAVAPHMGASRGMLTLALEANRGGGGDFSSIEPLRRWMMGREGSGEHP